MNKLIVVLIYLLVIGYSIFSENPCAILIGVLFIICFFDLLRTYYKTNVIRLFDLKNYFLLNFFYIHGLGYFSYLARVDLGLNWYYHSTQLVIHSLIVSIGGVLTMLLLYHVTYIQTNHNLFARHFQNINNFLKLNSLRSRKWRKYALWVVLLFGIFWSLMGVVPFLTPGFHETGRTEFGKGLGLIEAIAKCLLGLSSLFYIWKLKTKGCFDRSTLFFFLFCVLIFILNDERGSLIYYIINIAFIYYLCKKPISTKIYIMGFLCIVLLAGAIGVMRRGTDGGVYNIARIGIEVATETAVEFDNYVETYNMFRDNNFLYGSTLVPIFTIPIPRIIFPEKDKYLTAGVFFKEYHGHDHIRVGERLTFIGELYMNWGYWGVFLGMSILGVFIGKCTKWLCRIRDSIHLYLYISIVSTIISLIAGDIATAVVNFFMNNVLIFCYLFIKRRNVI